MKDSAFVGGAVSSLLGDEEMIQEQMAFDLNVSSQLISHYKNNRRRMQQDIAKQSLNVYDDPIYAMEIIHEFSGGFTSPVLRGDAIEKHRLAFKEFLHTEAREAFEKLKEVNLMKSPSMAEREDIENIKSLIAELDDAEIAIANFKMILAKEYSISLKDLKKQREATFKAKGWV